MELFKYIHKSPHRNKLEVHLKHYLPALQGPILDIGSKNRRYDHLLAQKPTAIDLVENKEKDVSYGDVTNLKFEGTSFSSVLCLEVLEYLKNPEVALREIARVLVSGGTLVLSVPFMYGNHRDRLRHTRDHLTELLKVNFSQVKIEPIGNFYTIILDIIRGKIIKIRFSPLRYLCYIPYFFLTLFIPLFSLSRDEDYCSGYFVVAQK